MGTVFAGGPSHTVLAVLGYGMLLFVVYTFGTLFELAVTRGVCFLYVIGYFLAFVVVLAIRRVGRFGTGAAVFLPYAVLGVFFEYEMEVVASPVLVAWWAAVIWSLNGPLAGLSADLANRFLPRTVRQGLRPTLVGIVAVSAYFLLTLGTLAFLYNDPAPGLAHFLNGIYLTLPWLLVAAGFGGYTAYTMSTRAGGG